MNIDNARIESSRDEILNMVKSFKDKNTGNATITLNDKEYIINMFRQNNLMVLVAANNSLPEVFGISDGTRIALLNTSSHGIVYDLNPIVMDDVEKPMLKRRVVQLKSVAYCIKQHLQEVAQDVCARYVREQYGDAEPLASCTCTEDADASIAASYWCNKILATTGSFEDLHDYVNVDIDDAVVQDDKPVYKASAAFCNDITDLEAVAYFFHGEEALRDIINTRFEKCKNGMIRAYCEHCIRLVKWYNNIKNLDTDNVSFMTALTINKAIKAFLNDEKFADAIKLTYTVRGDDDQVYRFRLKKWYLMPVNGLPNERLDRVPNYRVPSWYDLRHLRPEHVEEIRYVKHIVYKKEA